MFAVLAIFWCFVLLSTTACPTPAKAEEHPALAGFPANIEVLRLLDDSIVELNATVTDKEWESGTLNLLKTKIAPRVHHFEKQLSWRFPNASNEQKETIFKNFPLVLKDVMVENFPQNFGFLEALASDVFFFMKREDKFRLVCKTGLHKLKHQFFTLWKIKVWLKSDHFHEQMTKANDNLVDLFARAENRRKKLCLSA